MVPGVGDANTSEASPLLGTTLNKSPRVERLQAIKDVALPLMTAFVLVAAGFALFSLAGRTEKLGTSQPDAVLTSNGAAKEHGVRLMRMPLCDVSQDAWNAKQLADRCVARPSQCNFCVFVLQYDGVYRISDLMAAWGLQDAAPLLRDPIYKGTMLRGMLEACCVDKNTGKLIDTSALDSPRVREIAAVNRIYVKKFLSQMHCAPPGPDTLLVHVRSGDSGWIAHMGNAETREDGSHEQQQQPLDDAADLGLIDDAAIARIREYLRANPQIVKVELSSVLHFGVFPPGTPEAQILGPHLTQVYGMSDAALAGSGNLLRKLFKQVEAWNKEVWATSSNNADEDLCRYAKACHFMSPDGRGFSKLSTSLNDEMKQC